MNAIKNKFLILLLILFVIFSFELRGNAITITSGSKIEAGKGSWKSWANKKYDGNKLLYCSQKNKNAPSSCSTTTDYSARYSAAVSYIIDNTSNYICAEQLINKFLYNYYETSGRTNPDLKASSDGSNGNWVTSCTNASNIYTGAINTFNIFTNIYNSKILYNNSKIEVDSSGKAYITLNYNSNYEPYCTVNYGQMSISGGNITITGANDRRLVLSCIPRKIFTTIKSYHCGNYQNLLGKGGASYVYGIKTTLPVQTKYTFKYWDYDVEEKSLAESKSYNQKLTIAANPFTHTGYVFKGWNVQRKFDKKWYVSGKGWYDEDEIKSKQYVKKIYKPGQSQTISNAWVGTLANTEFHFFAQWEEANVTISYNANGGTGTMSSHTTKYNDSFNIKSNEFVRPGYQFVGWEVKRKSDSNWYVAGKGWITQNEISISGLTKKIYENDSEPQIMGNSWFIGKPESNDKYKEEFIFYAKWEPLPENDQLIINKVYKKTDGTFAPIISPATFNVYRDESCTGEAINTIITTSGVGSASFDLGTQNEVMYYIQEEIPPMNYDIDETCHPVILKKGKNTEIQIVNQSNCQTKLDNLLELNLDTASDEYKKNLIMLYNEYGKNNLLNFESPSCGETTNCYTNKISCLGGSYELNGDFHQNNLSCFNDKITNNDGYPIAFCSTTLNINNNLELSNEVYSDVLAGQILMHSLDDIYIATSKVTSTCYFVGDNIESEKKIKLPVLKLSGTKLIPLYNDNMYDSDEVKIELKEDFENNNLYIGAKNFEYFLPKIYAKRISGKIFDESGNPYTSDCLDCKYLGRGIASRFNSTNGSLSFEYSLNIDSTNNNIFQQETNSCPYKSTPKLITYDKKQSGELQIEFRTVDTKKPFERKTNTNWCSNEEGTINCNSNNNLVKNVIEKATNSNGISINGEQDPIYKIKLTSNDIKLIREYNETTSYDDYSYVCTKDENDIIVCKNNFLVNLENGGLPNMTVSLSNRLEKIIRIIKEENTESILEGEEFLNE